MRLLAATSMAMISASTRSRCATTAAGGWPRSPNLIWARDNGDPVTTNVEFEIGERFTRELEAPAQAFDHHAVQWVAKSYRQYPTIAERICCSDARARMPWCRPYADWTATTAK